MDPVKIIYDERDDDQVWIYKTNIVTPERLELVHALLDQRPAVNDWNVDMEDCDKVMRIETSPIHIDGLLQLLREHRIDCEELA